MMLTFAEISKALGDSTETLTIGDISYRWGNEGSAYVIIEHDRAEIARIGRGLVHGMIYLTGAGESAMRLHNDILKAHNPEQPLYLQITDEGGVLWVTHDGYPNEPLMMDTENNPGYMMGAIFLQRTMGSGLYHFYKHASQQAAYNYIDFDIDVYNLQD